MDRIGRPIDGRSVAYNDEVTFDCCAAFAACQRAVVTAGAPQPRVELEPSPPVWSLVVLAGRATHVPEAAVTNGIQRTTTDSAQASSTCTILFRRRSRSCSIWLWEQGVGLS
jgi:hypothetical protein